MILYTCLGEFGNIPVRSFPFFVLWSGRIPITIYLYTQQVKGCDKQAQGTHQGMCKRHWRELSCPGRHESMEQQVWRVASSASPSLADDDIYKNDDNDDDDDDDADNDESERNSGSSNNHSFVITDEPMNKRSSREQRWNAIYERLVAYKKEHNTAFSSWTLGKHTKKSVQRGKTF